MASGSPLYANIFKDFYIEMENSYFEQPGAEKCIFFWLLKFLLHDIFFQLNTNIIFKVTRRGIIISWAILLPPLTHTNSSKLLKSVDVLEEKSTISVIRIEIQDKIYTIF